MTYTIDDGYIKLPIDVNPSVIQANALAAISNTLPGWVPRESHIEVLLLEQMSQMVSVSADVAAQVPEAIFSVYGSLVGIVPIQGQAATAMTLWTMSDTKGYTIPAGTVLGYRVLGNATYQFTNVSQFTVSPGNIDTSMDYPDGILIQAQNVGTAYNGLPLLPPAPQTLYLITSLSYVKEIAFLPGGTGTSGVDPESTAAYLDRLSNELHYLSPRPILPGDFAGLSTNVAGVYRATAFNGLNPYGNILTPLEALFNSSVTWTVLPGSPCTVSAYTGGTAPHAMRITGTGSGNAQVVTTHNSFASTPAGYSVSPNTKYIAAVQMQNASASRQVEVIVNFYDVAGYSTGTTSSSVSANATDFTSSNTFFWVPFTVPSNTFTATLEVQVQGIATSETHDVFAAGIMQVESFPTNLVPDSSFQWVQSPTAPVNAGVLSWALSNAAFSIGPFATETNAIVYTAADSSAHTYTASSMGTYLVAGTYTIAAWVDATKVTSSAIPSITIVNKTTSSNLTITWSTSINKTTAQMVYGTFTVPSGGGMIQMVFSTNNCTLATTNTVTFAAPQILTGNVTPSMSTYSAGPTLNQPGQIYNQERTITVAAVQSSGQPLDPTVATNLENYLDSQREVNFVVNVIPPTYTSIDVVWTATCYSNYDPSVVEAAIEQTVRNYLNPQTWALGKSTPPYWDPSQNSIWYLTVVTLIGEIPGVQHLESVGIRYTPSNSNEAVSYQFSDLLLPGYAPMPVAGYVKGNVLSA